MRTVSCKSGTSVLIFTFVASIINIGCTPNLNCSDFKEGTFIVPADEKNEIKYEIHRNGNEQVEVIDESGIKRSTHILITWVDKCSYKTFYDSIKMELTEYHHWINENGGILTKIIEIKGRCATTKSTFLIDGEKDVIEGQMCKKNE